MCLDNLENSSESVLDGINKITGKSPIFENIDIRDKSSLRILLDEHLDIKGVIHFAAYKAVEESFKRAEYFVNVSRDALAIFPNSREKNILQNLSSFSLNRSF